jgi:hypothetical protein
MSGKKVKKNSKKQRKAANLKAQQAQATVIRATAGVYANVQPGRHPTQTVMTAPSRASEQGVGGRHLAVEVHATTEIRPKEFIRVQIRLEARFPLDGDRSAQFAGLAGAARGVLDAEIAWVHAPVDHKPPTPVLAFPPACWARTIGVSYGCTVKKIPRKEDCFEFIRAEVGCTEPLDDGADATAAMAAIQDWLAVQIKEQVRLARGGQVATLV